MFKRLAALLFCLIFIFISVPSFSYADAVTYEWQNVTTNAQLVEAFRYYCKSRDLTIEGSAADVITSFTTQTFNNICNGIGIDVTAIQAHLKYATDQNGNVKYLWDSTGITAYNQIFAQFLQDNNLQVGDSANENDNKLYDGYMFTDDDGNRSLVWVINSTGNGSGNDDSWWRSQVVQEGTFLKYKPSDIYNAVQLSSPSTLTINANSNTYSFNAYLINGTASKLDSYQYIGYIFYAVGANDLANGYTNINGYGGPIAYCLASDTTRIRIGIANHAKVIRNGNDWYTFNLNYLQTRNITNNYPQAVVYLTTNNTVINNNNYEGDTIINPDGQPDVPEPSGGTPPNWDIGGGDGTATDPNGNTWNIKFPDFELPDLNIDWSIKGLENKFPFSIPFDIVSLVTVLNAPAEAPRFQGTVNFGFTTWNYDINLQPFDNVARACRIAELLLLVFGLIMITRSIIKG